MSINLVTIKETAIAEIVAATGSEQLIDKATRRNFVGLYDETTNWYIPLRANLGKKKPQVAVFDTPFKTTNPHFKRPGLDFQKAIYLEKDGVLPIRNTLPKEQSEFLEAHQDDVKRAFEQYILKVANHEMSDNQYYMSTPSLFPEGIEKIRQQVEQINHPEKSMQEISIMKLQNESKKQALNQADDGTKMFEFQFYDELIPGSYDADKNTVKINFTARDTINYQHHQFVAEADVLSPINSKNNIHLSTAQFFENNQDISKKLGVLDWTESNKNFRITLPQNKEELKQELEQAITTKLSDARASDNLIEVAKISGEIDTLESQLEEVSTQSITKSVELVQPLSLQELIAQKDLKGIEEHIKSGIANYLDSETFKNYLDFALQFRQYSYRNKILIQSQNPKASLVAGYRAWQDKGRQVQRGEKALKIFVPSLAAKKDKDGNYSHDKEGNVIKEVKGFYLASVYDVRQTEGEPIPKPIYELEENINNPQKFDWYIKAITKLSPVPIQFAEIKGTAKGFFVPSEKQITIRPGMSESQTIKTMLHEITHSILHDNNVPVFGSSEYARQEIEAESVAYMIANSLGIETQEYSFGYLASWTDLGLSLENLEKSLDLICNQAQKMMGELDDILKQIPIQEKDQDINQNKKQEKIHQKSSIKIHM
ncbi:ArdC-like ssDNA-binding domain-containing protein [Lactococcus lactis]|uniref:ArdC-like ssDNA-binding domain-containing protein n=1 Tax=Lactococcus lactis TaxID=1358 RepID=UPI00285B37D6|nr:ArdC-like ssDNA-binding domain-containing protein [Lactococcus lactis]MDR7696533.1 ArdC-like ssDNA-binding domain-containing protein [Lactococcus lactis]